jgi:hypothetical protein
MNLSRMMPVARRIASEPLPQFLAIGLALFGLAHLHGLRDRRPEIVVDAAQRDYQRNQFRGQFGADPDPARLSELLQTYVRDEVLYREALRLGLDRDDEIIRRRLIQKMEFLLTEGADVTSPTPANLAQYLTQHAAEFSRPPVVDFEHRYFADEASHSGRARAQAALPRLQQGAIVPGDAFPPGDHFTAVDPVEARKLFGDTAFVMALASAKPGSWTGPFQSGYGWHLLRVTDRRDASPASLEEVEPELRSAWLREARENAAAARIAALVRAYHVTQDTEQERKP